MPTAPGSSSRSPRPSDAGRTPFGSPRPGGRRGAGGRTGRAVGGAALAGIVAVLSAAPGAQAAAPKVCKLPDYPGTGSFAYLNVTGTTCATGAKIARAFTTCRTKTGPSGRCVKKVSGYACRESRINGPEEITGKVTCTKGKAKIVHGFRQTLQG
jgi:hypothetical protein